MSNSLATYLQDHLAGSIHAIELVQHIRDEHAGESLGDFAAQLLVEIRVDQEVLQGLAERIGAGSSSVKEVGAWIADKVARLKLTREAGNNLGTFEALEFLELGINGKLALWIALEAVASADSRLQGIDFDRLIARANSQIAQVEERRLAAAHMALS
jgi:hypothetical protein